MHLEESLRKCDDSIFCIYFRHCRGCIKKSNGDKKEKEPSHNMLLKVVDSLFYHYHSSCGGHVSIHHQ